MFYFVHFNVSILEIDWPYTFTIPLKNSHYFLNRNQSCQNLMMIEI